MEPSGPRRLSPKLAFRTDLYRGTAPFYDRYRPPYPQRLFDDLCRRLPVSGKGRLLDLACGTGQIAIPLAPQFAEIVAVDQEEETVAFGQTKAASLDLPNIVWVVGSAETVDLLGSFELVTIGNAFHRLDREVVASRVFSWLRPGGGVAVVWSDAWIGDAPWQQALAALFADWLEKLGTAERIPAGWQAAMDDVPHALVLQRAGFEYTGKFEFTSELTWTLESLAGYMYSTSVLNREVFGERIPEFEDDLARQLAEYSSDGLFHQSMSSAYELARKPT